MINVNIDEINISFNKDINKDLNIDKQLFTLKNKFNGLELDNTFLLCGRDKLNYLSYNSPIRYKNNEICDLIDNDFLISIKHHAFNPCDSLTETLKFQCTHAQAVIKNGKDFVFTINNPQDYESGRFGKSNYPMIFVRPVLTDRISTELKKDYYQNIKNWLLLLNTYTEFPSDYNGGDPLNGSYIKDIKRFGDLILGKILIGTSEFDAELSKHPVYCAELIYLALNLGLYYPLNREEFLDIEDNLGDILNDNDNPFIDKFPFLLCENLEPINKVLGFDIIDNELFSDNLAIRPLTSGEMLTNFFKESINSTDLYKLSSIKRTEFICSILNKFNNSTIEFNIEAQEQDMLLNVIAKEYESLESFNMSLFRILNLVESKMNKNKFIPPHTFIQRIQNNSANNIMNFEYVGHGLHDSFLTKEHQRLAA
jgi:hypothetical protein